MPNPTRPATFALILTFAAGLAQAHDGAVPLGDGKVSDEPKRDYVFSCQQDFQDRPGPAQPFGPWIKGDLWYPDDKPFLSGNVIWSEGGSEIELSGDIRSIHSHSVPDHGTGEFPIPRDSALYRYDRNPNEISPRRWRLDLPAKPEVAARPSCLPMGPIGIALSGAAIFNALDAVGLDAAAHEIQDKCGGHPERRGLYHYHAGSDCMTETSKTSDGHSGLVGYALDGFGIFGPLGESGEDLSNADLDACHGHTGKVIWDGKTVTLYHYHLTAEYPYTLGCFTGTPAER